MSKSWKNWELRVAKLFGCKRRGPDFRGEHGGKDDLTHAWYAVEVKLLARPTYQQMLDACRQAESAAPIAKVETDFDCGMDPFKPHTTVTEVRREPIAIVKRKGDRDEDALVIQRLATFRDWHI